MTFDERFHVLSCIPHSEESVHESVLEVSNDSHIVISGDSCEFVRPAVEKIACSALNGVPGDHANRTSLIISG
jgi:hypothetical protein